MTAAVATASIAAQLERLQEQFGRVYEAHAAEAAAASRPKFDHHERTRLQRSLATELVSLQHDYFGATSVRLSGAELEALIRLLPSLAALSDLPSTDAPLLVVVTRALQPPRVEEHAARVAGDVVPHVLQCLTRLLHEPETWAAGAAEAVLAVRTTAAALLARLLRYFVAHAEEAAVEAQWRQWQDTAGHALLERLQAWVAELATSAEAEPGSTPRRRPSSRKTSAVASSLPPPTAAALLCQLLSLVVVLVEHPCARALSPESWAPLLGAAAAAVGAPRRAPARLELAYTALHVVLTARDAGVVPPGMWRERGLQTVARSVPRGEADAPAPLPVSSLSSATLNYAALFLAYVRLAKALTFLEVEESATGSETARSTAAQLHGVLTGLIEMSAHVFMERGAASSSFLQQQQQQQFTETRVSLLPAVVKDLLSVREESRSSPRQYARYVQGMLVGRTPLVPYIVVQLVRDCKSQMALLASPRGPVVLSTNAEILQGVFLWSIHAAIDEGLLDLSHRAEVMATLPWERYDAADVMVGELTEQLAEALLTLPALCTHRDAPLLAARVAACEGLALLLRFLLFVVVPCGVGDEASWNVRYRNHLYAAEERVMRVAGAFDCGSPAVLAAFAEALDRMSTLLSPTAAKVSALLPSTTRPALVTAGCQGALDKLMEVMPIF